MLAGEIESGVAKIVVSFGVVSVLASPAGLDC